MIKNLFSLKNNYWLIIYLFIPLFILNFTVIGENSHVYLAYAFLNSSFSLVKLPPYTIDLTYFNNNYYWPAGISPSTLLIPFVWIFDVNFQESLIKFPLSVFNFWLIFKIAKSLTLSAEKAIWLAIFFIFGSIYLPLAILPFSVYLTQIVATTFLLLSIFFFLEKKPAFLIGISLSAAILARSNLILAVPFFLLLIFGKHFVKTSLLQFLFPITVAIIFIGFYNFARFGSFLENGYRWQIVPKKQMERRSVGLFSVKHIPANLYYMLIKTPNPVLKDESHVLKPPYLRYDPYGMSIFFMSPVLFLIFWANFKEPYVKSSLLTTLVLLVSISLYYGIGYKQVGYRYALDFFPFILIPLISTFRKINLRLIIPLVLIGVFFSWFFTIEFLFGF